jgi:hypothetical protein
MSTIEITALKTTYRGMITASTDIDRFIIQFSTLMAAEKSSETNWRTRRVATTMTIITTIGREYLIRWMRETEHDLDIQLNTIPSTQLSAIISQRSYNGQNALPAMAIIMITGFDPINERNRMPSLQVN